MKIRYVYTVIRAFETTSDLQEEVEEFQGIKDEAGEYLYGGVGCLGEEIGVRLEYTTNFGATWEVADERKPK